MTPWSIVLGLVGCADPAPPCRAEINAFADADGDGFGSEDLGLVCELAAGQSDLALDCDDADPQVHPEARERCNGLDDDCDGSPDQDLPGTRLLYADLDHDGFGAEFPATLRCGRPDADQSERPGDCDDTNVDVHPGGTEVCNGFDDDCDFFVDDGDDDTDRDTMTTWFRDLDGDGFGADAPSVVACSDPGGFVPVDGDCAPEDVFVFPGQTEIPGDDVDQDCDRHDLCWVDNDRDDVGGADQVVSEDAVCDGRFEARVTGDCDDEDRTLGLAQEWYADADGDGYGEGLSLGFGCVPPAPGAVGTNDDCGPSDPTTYPGAEELACDDSLDQDCDGELGCCSVVSDLEASGWPALIDFDYCWSQPSCPYSAPPGATWTLQLDGSYRDSQGATGNWEVDTENCVLIMNYVGGTTYTGVPTGDGCYDGTMESGASWGTWEGCHRF